MHAKGRDAYCRYVILIDEDGERGREGPRDATVKTAVDDYCYP